MSSATPGGMRGRYVRIYGRLRGPRSGSPKTCSNDSPFPPAAKYRRLRRICRISTGSLSTSRVALRRSYSTKFTRTAAGLPLRVTTISSSRSSPPVRSSGRCVFTSETGNVRAMSRLLVDQNSGLDDTLMAQRHQPRRNTAIGGAASDREAQVLAARDDADLDLVARVRLDRAPADREGLRLHVGGELAGAAEDDLPGSQ